MMLNISTKIDAVLVVFVRDHREFKKTETTLSGATVQHENYISNSEWDWKSYSYEITPVTSVVRNRVQFSQERFSNTQHLYNAHSMIFSTVDIIYL